ncbi:hypothetical protein EDB83DRAFT_165483 [Lactarius deliciosus]|nr:hypothetical protein EDB83DRAFT_165483 [Lactarius deliciosus]
MTPKNMRSFPPPPPRSCSTPPAERAQTLGPARRAGEIGLAWRGRPRPPPASATPVGEEGETRGAQPVGVRDVVARLLVSDPHRRVRVGAMTAEVSGPRIGQDGESFRVRTALVASPESNILGRAWSPTIGYPTERRKLSLSPKSMWPPFHTLTYGVRSPS